MAVYVDTMRAQYGRCTYIGTVQMPDGLVWHVFDATTI